MQTIRRKVFTVANQMIGKGKDRSEAFREAWAIVRANPDAVLIEFFAKKYGRRVRRVAIHTSVLNDGRLLFQDLAKIGFGMKRAFISVRPDSELSLLAA